MPLPFPIDFKNPDYVQVAEWRIERLQRIRANPSILPHLYEYYANNPAQFIIDWGQTFDPRNADKGLPVKIPFLLFPRQEEFINFVVEDCWKGTGSKRGMAVKPRDVGMSWVVVGLSIALCTFIHDAKIGYTSHKMEYVDSRGESKSFFDRCRRFRELLPPEFRFGYDGSTHFTSYCKMIFPHNGSALTGEVGAQVGRGDRTTIYFVDEIASNANAKKIESSLSATTKCRIDFSTVNGTANPFAQNFLGKNNIKKFTFRWFEDPRKDQAWLEQMFEDYGEFVVNQEVLLDFFAETEGKLIPHDWIQAAIDAHKKLGLVPNGMQFGGFDVADEGKDKNALICGQGFLIDFAEQWSGKDSDIMHSVEKVFGFCDENGVRKISFDADGLGVSAKGDARVINQRRQKSTQITFTPFKGSSTKLWRPDAPVEKNGITNKEFFYNLKAQNWWALRQAFRETYRAITREGYQYNENDLISLCGDMKNLDGLINDLGQIRYYRSSGKILIDKTPEGMSSPNLGDALMIARSKSGMRRAGAA